jgi:hypothetical protein
MSLQLEAELAEARQALDVSRASLLATQMPPSARPY